MIKRYYATKDNTITNAFEENLTTRGTGSNMGASDIVEVFSIYGQASSASAELARTLVEFDITEISSSRDTGAIPAAGSVSFYLNMFNAPHIQTTPSDFTLSILAVSQSWQEGYGLDMEFYEDITRNGIGSNWVQARQSASADNGQWDAPGGDYHASPTFSQTFSTGLEDLSVDVTSLVEEWIDGTKENYGVGIKLTDSFEAYFSSSTGQNTSTELHNLSGQQRSFFTKKFFGRDSEFFFQKPVLEARWDSSRKDDRGYFFASSSLVPASDNLNNLYLYNRVRGRLRDYPTAPTSASIRASSTAGTGSNLAVAAVSRVSTGIYEAQIAVETTESVVYDIWYNDTVGYHTGSISVKSFEGLGYNPEDVFFLSMPSLRKEYRKDQTHRLNLYVREKNWSPNIHTIATRDSIPSLIIPSASFQIRRCIDDYVVVPYGTGSTPHTGLSYDVSGNYFDLDTTYLESGYLYDVQYSFYDEENGWEEQPYRFKFRVVN